MARLEAKLARLAALAEHGCQPRSPALEREVLESLGDRSAHVVARAARLVEKLELDGLVADVEAQFARFRIEPQKTDKGCVAKTAIIRCLVELERGSENVFLLGLHQVQMEPAYGGRVDTAVELRAHSARGLVSTGGPETLLELTAALTDAAAMVRSAAVRALCALGRADVTPVLWLKTLLGDTDPQVLSESLEALLALSPARALPLVERYLDGGDEADAEAAALALGASRGEEALAVLTKRVDSVRAGLAGTFLLAISMLRREDAIAFLLDRLEQAPRSRAESIVKALAIHRHDDRIRDRAARALKKRADRKSLEETFRTAFD